MPALINPVYCGGDDSPGGHRAPQNTQQGIMKGSWRRLHGQDSQGKGRLIEWQLILLLISTTDIINNRLMGIYLFPDIGNGLMRNNIWLEKKESFSC